ncbi:MAG TPA: hypothetical protein PKA98_23010 [Acidimicrobiales bacterium]|nr:hypothetical protein [Acidimicrobiales bacterium]
MGEGVLELLAGLGPLGDDGGVDGELVVPPPLLDLVGRQLAGRASGGVDGQVVDDPSQPRRQRRVAPPLADRAGGA